MRRRGFVAVVTGSLVAVAMATTWLLWNYVQFRNCARTGCPPSAQEPPIRLTAGTTLPVIDYRSSEDGRVVIEYLSTVDRRRLPDLCAEGKAVWSSIRHDPRLRNASKVTLGPTSAKPELVEMKWLVVPVYLCCVSTYVTLEKNPAGEWHFRQAACEPRVPE